MVKIIETNIIYDKRGDIADHQSRMIECENWQEYISYFEKWDNNLLFGVCKIRNITNLVGNILPKDSVITDLSYDSHRLQCKFYRNNSLFDFKYIETKLSYLVS